MTEVGLTDALIARNRCLAAIVQSNDFETQRSLWKAALRYNGKGREMAAERLTTTSLTAVGGGG